MFSEWRYWFASVAVPGRHFQVTEVVTQVTKCVAARPEGPKTEARIEQERGGSGGALTASQRCLVRSAGDQEICDRNVTEGSGLNK